MASLQNMAGRGLLIVLSGPSGVGKGTLYRALCQENPQLVRTTSLTTRPPRYGEEDGVDYHFVDEKKFMALKEEGAFLEWAKVHGNFYGTLAQEAEELLKKGYDVIMEIDVQGAAQVRSSSVEAILLFILPPSMEELWRRINGRGSDTPDAIKERFKTAHQELKEVWKYDYVVVNDTVSRAVRDIEGIILAEKCRVQRNTQFLEDFMEKR